MSDFGGPYPPGLAGFMATRTANDAASNSSLQNAAGQIGILSKIQAMQQQQQLQGLLSSSMPMEEKQAALMRTPGGLGILKQIQEMASAQQLGKLREAQIGDYGRKADVEQRKQGIEDQRGAAVSALAGMYSPATYDRPGQTPVSRVLPAITPNTDQTAEDNAAIEAFKASGATAPGAAPMSMVAPNKEAIQGLAIQADPKSAIQAILKAQNPAGFAVGSTKVVPGGYLEKQSDGSTKFIETRKDAATTAATAGASGVGLMTPETLKFTAQQILAGDRQAGQGYARSAPLKAALQNAVQEEAKAQGVTGKDLAGIMAEYTGFQSGQRAVGTRQAQIEMAATVANQFAPLAVTASEAFDRTPFKTLNDIEKAVLDKTASPELRKFNFANNALINSYARAINPSGVKTDSDTQHAREILNTGFSKGDYKAAVDQLQIEINAELKAPGAVRKGMREFFKGDTVPTTSVIAPKRAVNPKTGETLELVGGKWQPMK